MTTTKTNREIVQFINHATDWQARQGAKNDKKEPNDLDTKFGHAIKKMVKRCTRLYEKYQERIEDINLKFAAVDEKSILLRDDRNNYKYTKEDMQRRLKEIRELGDVEVNFEPHFAPDVPASVVDQDPFVGFVIRPEPEVVQQTKAA